MSLTNPPGLWPQGRRSMNKIFPKPGWVEHDPLEILRRTEEVIAEARPSAACAPQTSPPSAS